MKKIQFLSLLLGMTFGSLAFTACSDSDSSSGGGEPPIVFPGDPNNMKFASFSGIVRYNKTSRPLAGVTVISGDQVVKTDQNGFYKLDKVNVNAGRVIINFEKAGFMSVTRSIPQDQNSRLDVTLVEIQQQKTFNSESDDFIQIGDGDDQMTVLFGAGYVKEDGTPYTGQVTAEAVYLDPDDDEFANQMPGDLSAVDEEGDKQLISYGMVAVNLTGSNGEKLELDENNTAILTFPIPDRFKENPPASIALWYFDEAKGLWIKEGVAAKFGNCYQGTVTHFSWHNLDAPELKATLKVKVVDKNDKPLKYVPVDIDGERMFYTDEKGEMKCDVASEWDFYVRIPSEAYGNYAYGDASKEKKVNVKGLEGNSTENMTIKLDVAAPIISGAVLNQGAGSNICAVYITDKWGNSLTEPVMSDLNGAFQIFAPADRGEALLVAKFGDGTLVSKEFTITDSDQRIDLVANNNSGSTSASFNVTDPDGLNVKYWLPNPPSGSYWPAVISSGTLSIGGNTMPEDMDNFDWNSGKKIVQFNLNVNNYDASKTDFTDAHFSYFEEGGPHLRVYVDGPAKVVKNGDVYTVKMTNVPLTQYEDQMRGMSEWEPKPGGYFFSIELSGKAQ
jgi:hypothetical protein